MPVSICVGRWMIRILFNDWLYKNTKAYESLGEHGIDDVHHARPMCSTEPLVNCAGVALRKLGPFIVLHSMQFRPENN